MSKIKRLDQLATLFQRWHGRCALCGHPADWINPQSRNPKRGKPLPPTAAVRFRLGSGFGMKGKPHKYVLAHRQCAQQRSDEIQASIDVDELRARSQRWPTEFYAMLDTADQEHVTTDQEFS